MGDHIKLADDRKLAVGRRIKAARERMGMSQNDLARKLDLTAGAVGQWELGLTIPKMSTFDALPALLDVSRDWLLTGEDPNERHVAQTKTERALLIAARDLTASQQEMLLSMVNGLREAQPPPRTR